MSDYLPSPEDAAAIEAGLADVDHITVAELRALLNRCPACGHAHGVIPGTACAHRIGGVPGFPSTGRPCGCTGTNNQGEK